MTNQMIPISEIDSLIKQLEDYSKFLHDHDTLTIKAQFEVIELVVIPNLRGLEKKAIPAIPISKIDAKIKSFERLIENPDHLGNESCGTCSRFKQIIEVLEDLKK